MKSAMFVVNANASCCFPAQTILASISQAFARSSSPLGRSARRRPEGGGRRSALLLFPTEAKVAIAKQSNAISRSSGLQWRICNNYTLNCG